MAQFCNRCGKEIPENIRYCPACGAPVQSSQEDAGHDSQARGPVSYSLNNAREEYRNSYRQPFSDNYGDAAPENGSRYAPISALGYVGIFLLLGIPVIGLILAIIWACGGCRKVNKRNLARASLIMIVISVVLCLVFLSFAKTAFKKFAEAFENETGTSISEYFDFSSNSASPEDAEELQELLNSLPFISNGEGSDLNIDIDIEKLDELESILQSLNVPGGQGRNDISGIIEGAERANREAEEANSGWPSGLRDYPGGSKTAVTSYRTEITGTSLEEMKSWIEQLKGDGFSYEDFYDFGMTEEEMLRMNAWWATDGDIFISVSYADGRVTVDHTYELPDLSVLFK